MTYVLVEENIFEEEIKKSRFIAIAQPVSSASAAMEFFKQRSIAEARHNCWAYKVGEEYRFSDDGEPAGTAGRPILQAIEGQSCDYVAVLVIRWFGGIKLGTGGLARAYAGVTAECLRTARKRKYVPTIVITAFCPYAERSEERRVGKEWKYQWLPVEERGIICEWRGVDDCCNLYV